MNNKKNLLRENKNGRLFPIGKTGIYVSPDEFSQFVVNLMTKTPDYQKKEQLEKIGKILFVGGLGALLFSAFLKE